VQWVGIVPSIGLAVTTGVTVPMAVLLMDDAEGSVGTAAELAGSLQELTASTRLASRTQLIAMGT
jgi:hypothetical protein